VRAAVALCLLLVVACTGHPTLSFSTKPSPSPPKIASGGVVEYAVPNPIAQGGSCFGCGQASLVGIAAGADGNLWFVDTGQYKVGRITPSGLITEFAVPEDVGGPYGITPGPDGNIWITTIVPGPHQDWILRMSPQGAVTQFQAGKGTGPTGTRPEDITSGPDGNLWFTEFAADRIGRMTPAGVLTEFRLPGTDRAPRGIVTGRDGNLWFVESHFNHTAIGRITTRGIVAEYPLGGSQTDQLQPIDIVAAPDGNLWFNQTHPSAPQGEVGRITPKGAITLFPFPAGGRPEGLAVGADGNVWATDNGGNAIARISPTGAIRPFALPRRDSQPYKITSGKDGRMWFTEAGGMIGSIGLKVPEARFSSSVLRFSGSDVNRTLTLTNSGDTVLYIDKASLVGIDKSMFSTVHDECSGRSVDVQASCRIDVAFKTGGIPGVNAARLTIADNATGSPQSVWLLAQLPDCKLPLFAQTAQASTGEFLSLADGQVIADPAGAFDTSGIVAHSIQQPVLSGIAPAVYDRPAGRWVPGVVSPDGSRYAYSDYSQGPPVVHVVDVATGRDRALGISSDAWSVLAFAANGIYVHKAFAEHIAAGLWIVDPDTGSLRTVFTDSTVVTVSAQTAWISATNTSDPLPQPPGQGPGFNELQSRDLKTSAITTWLYRSGTSLRLVAAAGDSLLVSGNDVSGGYLWAVTSPGNAAQITDPVTGDTMPWPSAFPAGPDAWWLGTAGAIYLWTLRTGAVLVAEVDARPAGSCA
jgi:streptogramin lyase